jgi:hypothetical protein
MKTYFLTPLVLVLTLLLIVSGCRTNRVVRVYNPIPAKQMPPGQAKKVYGHQSARAFAPGQQKKYTTVVYPNGKVVTQGNTGHKGKPVKGGKGKGKGKKK